MASAEGRGRGQVPQGWPVTSVVAVVVTYGPDSATARLIRALARQCRVVVVDNGSTPQDLATISGAIDDAGATLVTLGDNTGIAHAQNVGILRAKEMGASYVLLSDQDSLPDAELVATLRARLDSSPGCAAAGPYIAENKPGGDELVYVDRRFGPRRAHAEELAAGTIEAAFLLASGCLIPMRVLDEVGPMNESYFIDHVDLEWCLRARKRGYRLIVDTGARLEHSLGDETVRLPRRTQPVHLHGPIRCYYLVRNTIFLLRSGLLPARWRIGYLVWLAKFSAFHALLADRRRERIAKIVAGVRDGVVGYGGRF
ncbi:glycosyltransferase family 2 protein [Trueperella pecoris]|nr:glycosyltransferase family 2 protein [Trueperella pecoris]